MEIREVSDQGIQFLINEEGIVLKPYRDSAGIPTIGIGCTYYENGTKVKMSDPAISKEHAIALFKSLLKTYELGVYSTTRDDLTHNNFDPTVSCVFNIGVSRFKSSTLLKRINENPKQASIREAFEMYKMAGGKPVLLGRRRREADFYFKPQPVEIFKLTPTLMYDEHIKLIQQKLHLAVDGYFGPKTEQAVEDFQKKNKIIVDGIVGPQTMALIQAAK